MKHRWMIPALAALAFQGVPVAVAAQVTIGTEPPGFYEYNWFRTLGQTFTVPWEASDLTEFSFWVSPYYSPSGPGGEHVALAPPVFRLFVMGWDDTLFAPTGDVLFRSEARTGRSVTDGWTPAPYTFSTGGVALDAGGTYVAFLSTHEDPQPGPVCVSGRCYQSVNRMDMLYRNPRDGDPYAGGRMVGSDFWAEGGGGFQGGDAWFAYGSPNTPYDARFSATFEATAAPEPASMALLGTGLAGLVGAARRRRRREGKTAGDPLGAPGA